ncbi:MAG TPA: nucleoside-diphosphate kinase, partial [Candidatus Omnitrophota bacterium]|nr:nucleoside-diphosphate kinase [Candidatus Omnitrophota bacterium]
ESEKLVKYFLASMTIPKDDLWVNLSPYENDRIIPEELGKTELGRDMLAQDYILKQLTASLMYPEKELGKKFWDKIYQKAQEQFGTSEIPVNTFNKVWVLPETATVYEHGQTVYVVNARLKVMLDSDYQAMRYENENGELKIEDSNSNLHLQSSIIKEIIIPEIEKEVNEGEHFAPLRQIYHSLILAKWYKETVKNSLLSQVYADKKLTDGINVDDATVKDQIYDQYMEAYKKGVFNYIKEDYDRLSQEIIPRKYFSGGEELQNIPLKKTNSPIIREDHPQFKASVRVAPQKNGFSSPVRIDAYDEAFRKEFLAGVQNGTHTYAMIKPDAVAEGKKDAVVQELEKWGFEVLIGPETKIPEHMIRQFYRVHKDKHFFEELVAFMASGASIPLFLSADNAVEKMNEVKWKIREDLGVTNRYASENLFHASDSKENAFDETSQIFNFLDRLRSDQASSPVNGSKETAQSLIKRYKNAISLPHQRTFLRELGYREDPEEAAQALEFLKTQFGHFDPLISQQAFKAAIELGLEKRESLSAEYQEQRRNVERSEVDQDAALRKTASGSSPIITNKTKTDQMIDQLWTVSYKNDNDFIEVIRLLGDNREPDAYKAIDSLLGLLSSKSAEIRFEAVQAAGDLGATTEEIVEAYQKMLLRGEAAQEALEEARKVVAYAKISSSPVINNAETELVANLGMVLADTFLLDVKERIFNFKKDAVGEAQAKIIADRLMDGNESLARALAIEIERRLVSRDGLLLFRRPTKDPEEKKKYKSEIDRYNRVIEGVSQILTSDDYGQDSVFVNRWGNNKAEIDAIQQEGKRKFTLLFFGKLLLSAQTKLETM